MTFLVIHYLAFVFLAAVTLAPALRSEAATRPNLVLVFIDDMGWGDFSCFGNYEVETQNIDRLAGEGIRFEQFYVNSPICSPRGPPFRLGSILSAGGSPPI